jgi:hypothetical protein
MGVFSPNKTRGTEDAGDMVRSIVVVLVVILVVGVYFLFARNHSEPVRVVDSGPQVSAARTTAGYHVLVPVALDPGWRVTSARDTVGRRSVSLHLGYLTPQGHYAALEETGARRSAARNASVAVALPRLPKGGQRLPPVSVAGERWQRWRDGRDTDLLRVTPSAAVVTVHGDAPLAELVTLATSLR